MIEIQHGAARSLKSKKYAMCKFPCGSSKKKKKKLKLIFVKKLLKLLKTLLEQNKLFFTQLTGKRLLF